MSLDATGLIRNKFHAILGRNFQYPGALRKIAAMLREISIRGFKLISDACIEFGDGFNVLTGETGAGKSQLLSAVIFGLGARASGDEISANADECSVEVTLDMADDRSKRILSERGLLEEDESEVILRRVQGKSGRSSAWLNGRKVPLGVLREVADELIEMLGQFERSRLLKSDALDILDELGDGKHTVLLAEVGENFRGLKQLKDELDRRKDEIDRLSEKRELMQYQYDELDKMGLSAGEEEKLEAENRKLCAAASLIESAGKIAALLYEADEGELSAYDLASQAVSQLKEMSSSDDTLKKDASELDGAAETLAEYGRKLASYVDNVQVDEERLSEVDSRLGMIHEFKRKHSVDFAGLLAKRDELGRSLGMLNDAGEDIGALEKQVASSNENLAKLAGKLTKSREKIAKTMEKEVHRHLKDLELGNAKFTLELEARNEIGEKGADKAQLLLSTNPAEPLKPLRNIASGGELSRILLALKAHLAGRDGAPILVFDEADVGIGGENAFKVGRKLKELANDHQLILISHLPQVAGMAKKHFRVIKKSSPGGKIESVNIEGLGKKSERVEELARMLGASADEKASRKLATGMLDPN